jgi:glycosyltransferase involved in cell wall biosynthesis
MRFVVGTVGHNQHIQNIVGALYEAGALGRFYTGGVDHWKSRLSKWVRSEAGRRIPQVNSRLARRRITIVPEEFISPDWRWEGWRLLAGHVGLGPLVEDWFWERSELALDRRCAELIKDERWHAFLGVEHGALFSIRASRSIGKKSVIAFLSPHHKTRERWVDRQYELFPELWTPATRRLLDMGKERDARRDQEARMADVVHCASSFTRNSLVSEGVDPSKMMMVPLGCPRAVSVEALSGRRPPQSIRFIYAGPVSVRKAAHILLASWNLLRAMSGAELHFYGVVTIPKAVVDQGRDGAVFHGAVSKAEMARAYDEASVLVFPTLCDGFGMVVAEALAHGVPVITTSNAGAADLIVDGRNGFVVPPGDPAALAERMQWCLDHPADIADMREEALASAARWTWSDFRSSFRNQLFTRLGSSAAA